MEQRFRGRTVRNRNPYDGTVSKIMEFGSRPKVCASGTRVEPARQKITDDDEVRPIDICESPVLSVPDFETTALQLNLQVINSKDLEEIGTVSSGQFSTVYHGKWKGAGVAVKQIKPQSFNGSPSEKNKVVDAFWQEASTLARLRHPNVISFYGVVPDYHGMHAVVTEYMPSGSLTNYLQHLTKPLDYARRMLIITDAAFGIQYLHDKNTVHFDLKGDNLLVSLMGDKRRPVCKVGDLGLSKIKYNSMLPGCDGTLPWMAPELFSGAKVSEKVDVYAFGMIMWELLTGKQPYAHLHPGQIMAGVMLNGMWPEVPGNCEPEWKCLMEKCWATEPSERPTFSEIVRELRCMMNSIVRKQLAKRVKSS